MSLSDKIKNVVVLVPQTVTREDVESWLYNFQKELRERHVCSVSKIGLAGVSEFSKSSDVVFSRGGYIARILYIVYY